MIRNRFVVACAATVVFSAVLPAAADVDVPLVNPSFEAPTLDQQNSWFAGVQGWGISPVPSIGTTYAVPWIQPAQNGSQYVWGDYDDFHLFQEQGTVTANKWYTLSAWVYPLSTGTNRLSVSIEDVDNNYTAFVASHYHPAWDPARADFTLNAGQWNYVQVEFNSAQFASAAGHRLRVHFEGYRVAIDNARFVQGDPRTYYVSSSGGNDANNGRSASTPWQTFNWPNVITLYPGERVNLKMDDQWNQELHLRGKGVAGSPIILASYGTGTNAPRITRTSRSADRCVVWEGPSHVQIAGLDCRNAKLGIYLRYDTDPFNSAVEVFACNFVDITDGTLDPAAYNYEYAWASGIFLGGHAWNQAELANILNGLTIRSCAFTNCDLGFYTKTGSIPPSTRAGSPIS